MSEKSGSYAPHPRSRLSKRVHAGLFLVGIATLVIGFVLLMVPTRPPTIGWFAYQPLSETTFLPTAAVLEPLKVAGTVVGTIGLLVLAFAGGWAFGRREAVGGITE